MILVVFYQKKKLYKEKYENILIYDISYKTSASTKPLRIRYNKISKAMMKLDIQYCFDCGWFDRICDRIKYKMKNKDITDSVNHTFVRIRIDSYNSLPTEKISSFYVIILIVKTLY